MEIAQSVKLKLSVNLVLIAMFECLSGRIQTLWKISRDKIKYLEDNN